MVVIIYLENLTSKTTFLTIRDPGVLLLKQLMILLLFNVISLFLYYT